MTSDRPTAVRYVVLLLLGLAAASAYVTRVMSSAATTLRAEYGVNDEVLGNVLASFALGYFFFQIPGGLLASSVGVRKVFPVISLAWSACCWWMTRATSLEELQWARFAVGVAQAGLVPCCAQALADWFPAKRRGIAGSVVGLSMQVGGVVATWLTARLLATTGWREIFAWYSWTGVVWAVAFYLIYRDRPEIHPWVNAAERELIHSGQVRTTLGQEVQPTFWLARIGTFGMTLLLSGTLWLICVQSFFRAFAYEFYTTWFPAFLQDGHGVDTAEAGFLAVFPLVAYGVGSLTGGVVVDVVYGRTGSKWISRSGIAAAGLGMAAVCTLAASWVSEPRAVAMLLSAGVLFAGMAGPATWAATLDVSGRHSALLFGIMNFTGNVGSFVQPKVVGRLFDFVKHQQTPDWNLVLYVFVGINLAGAVTWLLINPNRSAVERAPLGGADR